LGARPAKGVGLAVDETRRCSRIRSHGWGMVRASSGRPMVGWADGIPGGQWHLVDDVPAFLVTGVSLEHEGVARLLRPRLPHVWLDQGEGGRFSLYREKRCKACSGSWG
jgi:hypothetical protein